SNPSQLNIVTKPPEGPDLVPCKRQADPARQLTNLKGIPILIFTGEASYHAGYDYCTSEYLQQAGASDEYVLLGAVGIHGQNHNNMLEKNNLDTVAFVAKWLKGKGL